MSEANVAVSGYDSVVTPSTVIVTGTDTGVGKTVVTAALALAAKSSGVGVVALKPVETGVREGEFGEDALALAGAAGHAVATHDRLAAPLSPHRAATLEGKELSLEAIAGWIRGFSTPLVLVEGAGGWRVPFGERGSWGLRDLARALDEAPVLVVAADRLGVLNHALLTIEAIRSDGLSVLGIVLNRGVGDAKERSRGTNLEDLRELTGLPVAPFDSLNLADREARFRAGKALWAALRLEGMIASSH